MPGRRKEDATMDDPRDELMHCVGLPRSLARDPAPLHQPLAFRIPAAPIRPPALESEANVSLAPGDIPSEHRRQAMSRTGFAEI